MKFVNRFSGVVVALLTVFCILAVQAKGNDLKFSSTVIAINQISDDEGIVTILINGFELPVMVVGDTEVQEGADEVGLSAIAPGDFVRISAFFSDIGITAEEITIVQGPSEQFSLRGKILEVETSAALPADLPGASALEPEGTELTRIRVLGTDVYISSELSVTSRHYPGAEHNPTTSLSPADLVAGDVVSIRGHFDTVLIADRLHLGNREQGKVELDGSIIELSDTGFTLNLRGGGRLSVIINDASLLSGDLLVGANVEVEGMLNAELALVASEIVVDVDGDGDGDDDNHRRKLKRPEMGKHSGSNHH